LNSEEYEPTSAEYELNSRDYELTSIPYEPYNEDYEPTSIDYEPNSGGYELTSAEYVLNSVNYEPSSARRIWVCVFSLSLFFRRKVTKRIANSEGSTRTLQANALGYGVVSFGLQ
jgi:hypothetical protein